MLSPNLAFIQEDGQNQNAFPEVVGGIHGCRSQNVNKIGFSFLLVLLVLIWPPPSTIRTMARKTTVHLLCDLTRVRNLGPSMHVRVGVLGSQTRQRHPVANRSAAPSPGNGRHIPGLSIS